MMDFLDLRAASEEERKLIREILSDTSVVKIAQPRQLETSLVAPSAHIVPNARNSDQPQTNSNNQHQQYQQSQQSSQNQSSHHARYTDQQGPRLQHQHHLSAIKDAKYQTQQQQRHQQHHHPHYHQRLAGQQTNNRNVPAVPGAAHNSTAQLDTFINNTNSNNDGLRDSMNSNHLTNSSNTNDINTILINASTNTTTTTTTTSNTCISSTSSNTNNSGIATTLAPNLEQYQTPTMSLNVYNHNVTRMHSQVPPVIHTAKLDSSKNNNNNIKNQQQSYHTQDTSQSNIQSNSPSAQSVPPLAQMPSMAGDMNQVIGMDMSSTQPPSYAIPSHVTAFGPHHVYSGPPIFQPYPYLIPLQSYMPYVLPPNSVVPPRQQVPPQTSARSHPRPQHSHPVGQQSQQHTHLHLHHHQSAKQHNQVQSDPNVHNPTNHNHINENDTLQDANSSKSTSSDPNSNATQSMKHVNQLKQDNFDHQSTETSNEVFNQIKDSHEPSPTNSERPMKYATNNKIIMATAKNNQHVASKSKNIQTNSRMEKNGHSSDAGQDGLNESHIQLQKSIGPADTHHGASSNKISQVKDSVKFSSDEGFDSQSSLDNSKQSHESSLQANDLSKSLKDTLDKVGDKNPSAHSDMHASTDVESLKKSVWSSAAQKSWADLFKRGGQTTLGQPSSTDLDNNNMNSENYDEDSKSKSNMLQITSTSVNNGDSTVTLREQRAQEIAKRALDEMAYSLAHKVNSIKLKHSLPFLKPRGFVNKGNGCYINATLQALIACPPFYNLMKEIAEMKGFSRGNSCTPILDSFAELFSCFPPLETSKKNKLDSSQTQKLNISYIQADPIEPKCIYNVLGQIKSECLKGAQEDAEEFLSSVLNGLHDEMVALGEIYQESSTHNGHSSDVDSNDDVANDDNLWREVGPKNRSLPIRTAKVVNTPIQEIFGGSLFSIRTAGKDRCGHRSPFFDLQLDISGDNVESVQDAIKSFTATEVIHDFYCSKTKQKLDAQRRTLLDQLPPILILHLKQFVYTQDHGLKKLTKKIDYPIDFELPEVCLHERNFPDKSLRTFNGRSYKLLAVVYHDGKEAVKGHYLTDVYHIGLSAWIRCDDSNLKVVPAPRIENPDSFRTPYLLFYRRLNTLRAQTGNHDIKKKS